MPMSQKEYRGKLKKENSAINLHTSL